MLETSQDVLNIIKAVSLVAFVGFACWGMYYFSMIMRQIFKVVKEMRDRVSKVDELLKAVKDKIEHSTSYLLLIGEGVKKLVEVIQERTEKKNDNDKKE